MRALDIKSTKKIKSDDALTLTWFKKTVFNDITLAVISNNKTEKTKGEITYLNPQDIKEYITGVTHPKNMLI